MKQGMRQNQLPQRVRFQQVNQPLQTFHDGTNAKTKRSNFQAHKTRYGSNK